MELDLRTEVRIGFFKILHREVSTPTALSTANKSKQSMCYHSVKNTDILTHHDETAHRYVFQNTNKINTVYNAKNMNWQSIHNSITTEKYIDLINTDLIVQGIQKDDNATRIILCKQELHD